MWLMTFDCCVDGDIVRLTVVMFVGSGRNLRSNRLNLRCIQEKKIFQYEQETIFSVHGIKES